jgi:hypothetical protein
MKFFLFNDNGEYTSSLIKHVMSSYMAESFNECTHVMVSICDITELDILLKAKLTGKPVIAGGFISEIPILNEIADYVYHGEIFGLKKYLDDGSSLDDVPFITTKKNRILRICTDIEWGECPIVTVGKKSAYFYCSKGCYQKCKYCLMAYTRSPQCVPENIYRAAESSIEMSGRSFLPIGAYDPYRSKKKKRITELFLREYIKMDREQLSMLSLVRTGIEFCNRDNSVMLAKGVTSDHFSKALEISLLNRHRMICYFISGVESQEETHDFFRDIPRQFQRTPDVRIVGTIIDPQPSTPFFDFDLTKKKKIDHKKLYWFVSGINKRISVQQTNFDKATFRTLAQRVVSLGQYRRLPKSKSHFGMLDVANSIDERLLGSSDIKQIRERKRSDCYIGKTVIPYWEVA